MSLSAILSNAYTGLSASQANLRTISNNVANVNTANYARETVGLEALVAGGIGNGVRISEVRRVADSFLERAVYSASADASLNSTFSQFHDRLQGLLGSPDSDASLPARLDSIFSSVADLALNPSDVVRKSAVVSDITRFSDEVSRLAADIQTIRGDASNQMIDTVANINAALERIHALNPLIVRAKMTSNNIAGLEQQRAQAIAQLTDLIDISVINQPSGAVEIATGTGTVLVDQRLRRLDYQSPGVASTETVFPHVTIQAVDPSTRQLVGNIEPLDAHVQSGKLRALLDIRDNLMPDIADGLGELARGFQDRVNAVHSAFSAAPAPRTLSGIDTGLLAADLQGFTGTAHFAVTDSAGLLVAKTAVNFSALPAAATVADVVTAINAGLGGAATASFANGKLSLTATNPAHGVVVADDPAAATNRGDKSFAHYFGLNLLISSATPVNPSTGLTGTSAHGFTAGGTMAFEVRDGSNRTLMSTTLTVGGSTVNDLLTQLNNPVGLGAVMNFSLDSSGRMVMTPNPGYKDLSLRVISDTTKRGNTGRTVADFFGIDASAQARAAVGMEVREDIRRSPAQLALAQLDTAGVVGDPVIGRGDNRGAVALRALDTSVGSFAAAGELAKVDASLSAYAGFLLGGIAVQAEAAQTAREDAAVLRDNVLKRRDDFAGVNLDEEMANMVIFQNSYSASARLMTAAREMYDALLSIAQ